MRATMFNPSRRLTVILPFALFLIVGAEIHDPAGPRVRRLGSTSSDAAVRFAVIGDYGLAGAPESDVAAQVKSWQPDLVTTVGDNNYPLGAASTIDTNIGQYYHDFISPYAGAFGSGAVVNDFFPVPGNHDWYTQQAQPYLDYFSLPGNERYYSFVRGPVEFFMLDSDPNEPDGITADSVQGTWLEAALAASTAQWQIVFLHHAPYSSGPHGSNTTLQWPFQAWGADAVIAGHDHTYERIIMHGLPYFVDGLGGAAIYSFGTPVPGSLSRFNSNYGAMLVEASSTDLQFQFITRAGAVVDTYRLPLRVISGNAGTAGTSLSYVDGTSNTVTADELGDYAVQVSNGWSGTVTPSKAGFGFSPPSRSYDSVQTDLAGEDYAASPYPAAGTYDDDDTHWSYSGAWVGVTLQGPYGGTLHIGASQGATATFSFNGNRFRLNYLQYPDWGNLGVYLDGSATPLTTIYSSGPAGLPTYTSPVLAPGAHTVIFQHGGPIGAFIAIDSIEVVSPTYYSSGTYDDSSAAWTYDGPWGAPTIPGTFGDTLHIAVIPGSTGAFYFSGSSFSLTYLTYPGWGNMGVYIDGAPLATTLYTNGAAGLPSYDSPTLTPGLHWVEFRHDGPAGSMIAIDKITIP